MLYLYLQSVVPVSFSKNLLVFTTLHIEPHKFSTNFVPKELLLGYYNIHPYILYGGFIHLSINQVSQTHLQTSARWNFLLLSGALLLGGNWGWGNSSWGFFWVGDPIEWLLFALVSLSLFYLHFQKIFINVEINTLIISTICLALCSLRWGLIFSRHSFFAGSSLKNVILTFSFLNRTSILVAVIWLMFGKFLKIAAFVFLHRMNTQNITFTRKKKEHKVFFAMLLVWILVINNNYTNIKKYISNSFYNCSKSSFNWRLNLNLLTSKKLHFYNPSYLGTLQIKPSKLLNIITEHTQAFYHVMFL